MLNPFLQKTLFSLPVRPILVEVDLEQIGAVMGSIVGLRLKITGAISTFGLVAVAPVSPEMITFINNLPGVKMVHANQVRTILQLPTVPGKEWWPTSESRQMLEAEEAFKQGITGEAVKVGVADTGIDPTHPQLQGQEWYSTISWPFREVLDENGHGTHVASTIAGKLYYSPMQVAVEGVSHSPLVSVKCLGRGVGTGFTSEILEAIAVCYDKSAQVISMSLGSEDGEPQGGAEADPEWRIIRALTARGLIFVIAAGNSGPQEDTIGNPGSCPEAITVAAVDRNGEVASFSSRGGTTFPLKPDVAAPGVNIYSGTSRGSLIDQEGFTKGTGPGYSAISGTSMATPHVSGLVALLKHRFPDMTAARFRETMAHRGHAHDYQTGYGIPKWSYFV